MNLLFKTVDNPQNKTFAREIIKSKHFNRSKKYSPQTE
jgi:hypothetical protein